VRRRSRLRKPPREIGEGAERREEVPSRSGRRRRVGRSRQWDLISDSNVTSNEWVASVSLALDDKVREPARINRMRKVRAVLAERMTRTRVIERPPSPEEDERVNRRIPISGGSFQMGSLKGDPGAQADEMPQHPVTLSPFLMQEHEVTSRIIAEQIAFGSRECSRTICYAAPGA
jgi:hypothetical protein